MAAAWLCDVRVVGQVWFALGPCNFPLGSGTSCAVGTQTRRPTPSRSHSPAPRSSSPPSHILVMDTGDLPDSVGQMSAAIDMWWNARPVSWPVPTRNDRALAVAAAIGSQTPTGLCHPLVALVARYAGPGRLLYVVTRVERTFDPAVEQQRCGLSCYDETGLPLEPPRCHMPPVAPLWRLDLPLAVGTSDGVVCANERMLFFIDTVTSRCSCVDVKTRQWRFLPNMPVFYARDSAVTADEDFVWVCGGIQSGLNLMRMLVSYDLRGAGKWIPPSSWQETPNCRLPMAVAGHCLTALGSAYHHMRQSGAPPGDDYYPAAILSGGRSGVFHDADNQSSMCSLMMWSKTDRRPKFLPLAPMRAPRSGHTAAIVSGQLIVLGGWWMDESAHTPETLDLQAAITRALSRPLTAAKGASPSDAKGASPSAEKGALPSAPPSTLAAADDPQHVAAMAIESLENYETRGARPVIAAAGIFDKNDDAPGALPTSSKRPEGKGCKRRRESEPDSSGADDNPTVEWQNLPAFPVMRSSPASLNGDVLAGDEGRLLLARKFVAPSIAPTST